AVCRRRRCARSAARVPLAPAAVGFAPWTLEPFYAFKAVILRAIGLPLLLWWCVEVLSGRAAWRTPLTVAVLGWVAAGILATALSISPHLSVLGELSPREGLATTLAVAGLGPAPAQGPPDGGAARAPPAPL